MTTDATCTLHQELIRPQQEPFPDSFIYLPENEYAIEEGYYRQEGFVHLMRRYKHEPEAIQFLADMLE